MLTIPPYPYVVGESSDVPVDQCWVVSLRPQLFFSCHLLPRGARLPRRANYTYGPDDIQLDPSPTRVLPHLRAHGPARRRPYGSYGRAEDVRALTHAHSLCGLRPRRQNAGARALDAPLPLTSSVGLVSGLD